MNLLLAYALDLDPHAQLAGSLPVAVIGPESLGISFYAARSDVVYRVETSTNLGSWTTDGVLLSEPDGRGFRTATIARAGPRGFLRLVVSLVE